MMSLFHTLGGSGMWRDQREDNLLDGAAPYYAPYECADGLWVAVGAAEAFLANRQEDEEVGIEVPLVVFEIGKLVGLAGAGFANRDHVEFAIRKLPLQSLAEKRRHLLFRPDLHGFHEAVADD